MYRALIQATLHLVNREFDSLAADFITLGLLPAGSDRTELAPALTGVFQRALEKGVANLSFSDLSGELGKTMYNYGFAIPAYYTLLIRSLSVLEVRQLVGAKANVQGGRVLPDMAKGSLQWNQCHAPGVAGDKRFAKLSLECALWPSPVWTRFPVSHCYLQGIALSANKDYKVLGAAYPWIARRLLTERSEELRDTLRTLLYSRGRFQVGFACTTESSSQGQVAAAEPESGKAASSVRYALQFRMLARLYSFWMSSAL